MNLDAELIERIVAGVLQRLSQPGEAPPRSAAPSGSTAREPVHFCENVVTGESLVQRVDGHNSITIGPKTVLTPSALDFLRARGISWSRVPVKGRTPEEPRRWLAVIVRATPAVSAVLQEARGAVRAELAGEVREAVRLAVAAVCRADAAGAILFTAEAFRAACLANRNGSIRAVAAATAACAETAVCEIGANVLAVDPTDRSYIELRNMVRALIARIPQRPQHWIEPI